MAMFSLHVYRLPRPRWPQSEEQLADASWGSDRICGAFSFYGDQAESGAVVELTWLCWKGALQLLLETTDRN